MKERKQSIFSYTWRNNKKTQQKSGSICLRLFIASRLFTSISTLFFRYIQIESAKKQNSLVCVYVNDICLLFLRDIRINSIGETHWPSKQVLYLFWFYYIFVRSFLLFQLLGTACCLRICIIIRVTTTFT